MPRSFSITISAGLLLAGSLLLLLLGTLMFGTALGFPLDRSMPGMEYFIFLVPLVMLGLAVWGITTAIELFRLQPWARVSVLVIGGLLAFFGVSSAPFAFLLPYFLPDQGTPSMMRSIFVGVGVFYVALGALGGWWIYLFTRRSIRDRFVAEEVKAAGGPGRPLSITVIACLLLVGGAWFPVGLLMNSPAAFFALVVTGWKAALLNALFGVLSLSLGFSLLKGIPWSRIVAVYYYVFTVIHTGVFVLYPGRDERWAALMRSQPPESQAMVEWMREPLTWAMLPMVALTAGIAIWFLVTRKQAFLTYAEARRATRLPTAE